MFLFPQKQRSDASSVKNILTLFFKGFKKSKILSLVCLTVIFCLYMSIFPVFASMNSPAFAYNHEKEYEKEIEWEIKRIQSDFYFENNSRISATLRLRSVRAPIPRHDDGSTKLTTYDEQFKIESELLIAELNFEIIKQKNF